MTGTSGRQRVPNDCFDHLLICVPPTNIVRRFNEIVVLLFEMIKNNSKKSLCFKKARDLLLPKLISGEIDVSDLDIRIRNEFQES
jgi:type I restriction enzyme S subunit